jgi:hypothetical protein
MHLSLDFTQTVDEPMNENQFIEWRLHDDDTMEL